MVVVRVEDSHLGGETDDMVIDWMGDEGKGSPQDTYNLTRTLGALEKNWKAVGGEGRAQGAMEDNCGPVFMGSGSGGSS